MGAKRGGKRKAQAAHGAGAGAGDARPSEPSKTPRRGAEDAPPAPDQEELQESVTFCASSGYFACKGYSDKSTTSLADLGLSLGQEGHVQEVLDKVPVRHFNEMEALRVKHSAEFPKWRFLLRDGFSLLLHGFGSKRRLLEEFGSTTLTDGGLVAAHGFLPGASVRQILSACASALLRTPDAQARQPQDLLRALREVPGSHRLYVVLHSIDGPGLRDPEAQSLLSHLAACPAVSLIASMDHVDTPLLWDKQTSNRFNWVWQDATTFAPYIAEAAHMPSMLLGRKDDRTAKGAALVLQSLTRKARDVFKQLADNQDGGDSQEQGLPFQQWFKLCRERFLVTSELLLRTHLTEFKDHELVKVRRGKDGTDLYFIPLDKPTLEKVLVDMEGER